MKKLIMMVLILMCFGCAKMPDRDNDDGISYFITCIEGKRFVATYVNDGVSLAGPIGDCECVK